MSDRTNVQITIYDCPADQVAAVMAVIDEYQLAPDWNAEPGVGEELKLVESYVGNEIRCGSSDEMSRALQEAAPGASWEVWEDPKYEWLGSLNRFTPALGHFGAECDSDGTPVFTADQIRKHLDQPDGAASLDMWLGDAWSTALADLATQNQGKVLTPLPSDE